MDTKAITLNSGHVVTIKSGLSFRTSQALQRTLMGTTPIRMKPGDGKSIKDQEIEFLYANYADYQEEALRRLIVSVTDKDGNQASDPFDTVMELEEGDLEPLLEAVAAIIGSKKK